MRSSGSRSASEEEYTFPKSLRLQFEKKILKQQICWGDQDSLKYRQLLVYWRTAQKVNEKTMLPPDDWAENRNSIYLYFLNRGLSPSYAYKVIRVMNMWGTFYCKRAGIYFEKVPNPVGEAFQKIQEAFYVRKPRGHESAPLTLELLHKAKDKMIPHQWNWVFLSFWFGLRPSELENLQWKVEEYQGQKLLGVFQHKLIRLQPSQRWKFIPILFPEQKQGLELIEKGHFSVPLIKTVHKYIGKEHTLRAGRKGFVSLMWEQGSFPKQISYRWLGHRSIRMTEDHYVQAIQQACEFKNT